MNQQQISVRLVAAPAPNREHAIRWLRDLIAMAQKREQKQTAKQEKAA